jgi:phage replication O-like protein O
VANPQAENGHLDLANEIVEAMAHLQLSGYESRLLWVLWRKTYAWHKKMDSISLSQFSEATGIIIHNIPRYLKRLAQRNIITIDNSARITSYQFQKDYTKWIYDTKVLSNLILSNTIVSNPIVSELRVSKTQIDTIKIDNQPVSKLIDTKETITKETITKEINNNIVQGGGFPLNGQKEKHGEFQNVLLSATDIQKLNQSFGEKETNRLIENTSSWFASKGVASKYKNHYATILNYAKRGIGGENGTNRPGDKTDKPEEDSGDKFTKGRYGHMVQR